MCGTKNIFFIAREDFENILSYCKLSKKCCDVGKFPQLLENGIIFPILQSERVI